MLNSAIQKLIKSYLRDYLCVDEKSLESLVVSLWAGNLDIRDLELEGDAIQKLLGLPFHAERSKVSSLKVTVPWNALQSQPIEIKLSGVDLILFPEESLQGIDSVKATKKRNQEKIRKLETLSQIESNLGITDNDTDPEKNVQSGSFWEKAGTRIMNNVQLKLENIHIELKEQHRTSSIHIDEISMLSTDANWKTCFSPEINTLHKLIKVVNLEVFLQPGKRETQKHDVIFSQEFVYCKATVNRQNGSTKLINIDVELGDSMFHFSREQIWALRSVSMIPPNAISPIVRWQLAIRKVLERNRAKRDEAKRAMWVLTHRDEYVTLFKRTLTATKSWLPDLEAVEYGKLQSLEKDERFTFDDVVAMRKVAYQEVRIQLDDVYADVRSKRTVGGTKSDANQPAKQGWFSSWWGSTPAPTSQPSEQDPSKMQMIQELSQQARQTLFETIEYNPDKKDDVSVYVAPRLVIKCTMSQSAVHLTGNGQVLYSLELHNVVASLDYQERLKRFFSNADRLLLHDRVSTDSVFPLLLSPLESQDGKKFFDLDVSRAENGTLVVNWQVVQAMRFVWNPEFIQAIMHLLTADDEPGSQKVQAQRKTMTQETENSNGALASFDVYRAVYSEASIEEVVDVSALPSVSITIVSPIIIIPQDVRKDTGVKLEFTLGTLSVCQFASNSLAWDCQIQNCFVKMYTANLQYSNILGDTTIRAKVAISQSRNSEIEPRISVESTIPEMQLNIPMNNLHVLQRVLTNALSFHKRLENTVDYNETSTQPSDVTSIRVKVTEDPSTKHLASRKMFQLFASLHSFGIGIYDEKSRWDIQLSTLEIQQAVQTFESAFQIRASGFSIIDRSTKDIPIVTQDNDDSLFFVSVINRDPEVAVHQKLSVSSVTAELGSIRAAIVVDQINRFTNMCVQVLGKITPIGAPKPVEVTTTSSSSKIETKTSFDAKFTIKGVVASLLNEQNEICTFGVVQLLADVSAHTWSVSAQKIFATNLNKQPLITFSNESDQVAFRVAVDKNNQYTIDIATFDVALQHELYDTFRNIFLPLIETLQQTSSDVTPSPIVDASIERLTTTSSRSMPKSWVVNIVGKSPCTLRIAATESLDATVTITGAGMVAGGFKIDTCDVALKNIGSVATIQNVSIQGATVVCNSIEARCSPSIVAAITEIDILSTLHRFVTLVSGPTREIPAEKQVSKGDSPLVIQLNTIVVQLEDATYNNHGRVNIDMLQYAQSQVSLERFELLSEKDDICIAHDPCDGPSMVVSLDSVVSLNIIPKCYFEVHGESISLLMTSIDITLAIVALIGSLKASTTDDSQSTDSDAFSMMVSLLDVRIPTRRPGIEDVMVQIKEMDLRIPKQGRSMNITLHETIWETVFRHRFDIRVDYSDTQYKVNISNPPSPPIIMRLSPRYSYMAIAAFKNNLLTLANRPQFGASKSSTSPSLSFEYTIADMDICVGFADEHLGMIYFNFADGCFQVSGDGSLEFKVARVSGSETSSEVQQILASGITTSMTNTINDSDGYTDRHIVVSLEELNAVMHFKLLNALFAFYAEIEIIRVDNLLHGERADEIVMQNGGYLGSKIRDKIEFRVPNSNLLIPNYKAHGINIKGNCELVAFVDYGTDGGFSNHTILLNGAKIAFCTIKQTTFEIRDQFTLIGDIEMMVKFESEFGSNGLFTSRSMKISIGDLYVEALLPIIPKVVHTILVMLQNRPRMDFRDKIVQKLGLEDTSSSSQSQLMSSEGTEFDISVSLESFALLVRRRNHPVMDFSLGRRSTFGGRTATKAYRLSNAKLLGTMDISSVSLRCFNAQSNFWEPVVEPFDVQVHVESFPRAGHIGLSLDCKCPTPARINVYHRHIEEIYGTIEEGYALREQLQLGDSLDDVLDSYEYNLVKFTIDNRSNYEELYINGELFRFMEPRTIPLSGKKLCLTSGSELNAQIFVGGCHSESIPGTSLCSHVSLDAQNNFMVTIASPLVVKNSCDIAIQVACGIENELHHATLAACDIYAVPVRYSVSTASLMIRLFHDDDWVSINHTMKTSRLTLNRTHDVILRVTQNEDDLGMLLEILPIRKFVNHIPVDILARVESRNPKEQSAVETCLVPGGNLCLYGRSLSIRFGLSDRATWGSAILVEPPGSATTDIMYKIQHTSTERSHELRITVKSDFTSVLHVPFWLVDATMLGLEYVLEDGRMPLVSSCNGNSETVDTWEYQRWYPGEGWSSRMLPGNRHSWSNISGSNPRPRTKASIRCPEGWVWSTEWEVDTTYPRTGEEGWQYCSNFSTVGWTAEAIFNDVIRRRRWVRTQTRTAPGQPSQFTTKSEVVTFFAYSKVKVRLNGSSSWSELLDLSLVAGSEHVFSVFAQRQPLIYDLVLSVDAHDEFLNTHICTFTPRVIMMNCFDPPRFLSCIEASNNLDSEQHVDENHQVLPFHWLEQGSTVRVKIEENMYSEPFSIDSLEEFTVLSGDVPIRVDVTRSSIAGTIIIKFAEDHSKDPLYEIQNITSESIICMQRDDNRRTKFFEVAPYAKQQFAWKLPLAPRRVRMIFNYPDGLPSSERETEGYPYVDTDFIHVGTEKQCALEPALFVGIDGEHPMVGERVLLRTDDKCIDAVKMSEEDLSVLASSSQRALYQIWRSCFGTDSKVAVYFQLPGEAALHDHISTQSPLEYGVSYHIFTVTADGRHRFLVVQDRETLTWEPPQRLEEYASSSSLFTIEGRSAGTRISVDAFRIQCGDGRYLSIGASENQVGCDDKGVVFTMERVNAPRALPEREITVATDVDAGTRIIRVVNSMESDKFVKEERLRLDVSLSFDDIGVSLISATSSGKPREVLFAHCDLTVKMVDTNLHQSLDVSSSSLRIDNCCDETVYENMLRSQGNIPSEMPMFHAMFLQRHSDLNVQIFDKMKIDFGQLDVHLDYNLVEELMLVSRYLLRSVKSSRGSFELISFEDLNDLSNLHSNWGCYFASMQLSPLEFDLSFYKNAYLNLEAAPVTFPKFALENVVSSASRVMQEVILFYETQIKRQMFSLMGYALPGNPAEILSTMGGEVMSGNVVSGLFKGTVRSVAVIGAVGTAVSTINKSDSKRDLSKPQSFGDGFNRAQTHVSSGFSSGFRDFMEKSQQGAETGLFGAVSGFGQGLYGAVTKPMAGLGSAINSVSQGIVAETKTQEELLAEQDVHRRFREVRLLDRRHGRYVLSDYEPLIYIIARQCAKMEDLSLDLYRNSFLFSEMKMCLVHLNDETMLVRYTSPPRLPVSVNITWKEHYIVHSTESIEIAVDYWMTHAQVSSLSMLWSKLKKFQMADASSSEVVLSDELYRLMLTVVVSRTPSMNARNLAYLLVKIRDEFANQEKMIIQKLFDKFQVVQKTDFVMALILCRAYMEYFSAPHFSEKLEVFEDAVFSLFDTSQ